MREVELHSFLRKHGGLEGLARELGQSVPPDPEAPPAAQSHPTLVTANPTIVVTFRKECSAADGHPRQSGWRSDRAHPEPSLAAA